MMDRLFPRIRRAHSGFTLVETIVAIAILMVAFTGPLVLARRSLRATLDARNQLMATYLGDEGVEVIRGIRDNNSAQDPSTDRNAWMDGKDGGTVVTGGIDIAQCFPPHNCIADVTKTSGGKYAPGALVSCPSGNCNGREIIYQNNVTKFYSQFDSTSPPGGDWVKTPFARTIQVEGIDHANNPTRQVRTTVTVQFRGVAGQRKIVIAEDLYNWFPKLIP